MIELRYNTITNKLFGGFFMQIKASTTLRNEYGTISSLAHQSEEPIYITKNGEGDLVVMSIEAFEQREKTLNHRAKILEAEFSRLSGEPSYSIEEVRNHLREKYNNAEI
jgi:prevent-host-death family protein